MKDLERTFDEKELFEIIAHAEALQKLDEVKEDESHFQEALSQISSLRDNGRYPLASLYAASEVMKIPIKNLDQALNTYPSPEKQLEDLKNHDAAPNIRLISNTYKRDLINRLRESYPLQKFESLFNKNEYHPEYIFSEVTEFEKKDCLNQN